MNATRRILVDGVDVVTRRDGSAALPRMGSGGVTKIIHPGTFRVKRSALPNCTVCDGCSHTLRPISRSVKFNGTNVHAPYSGLSTALTVLTPSRGAAQGARDAVGKILCTVLSRRGTWRSSHCIPARVHNMATKLLAYDALKSEWGMDGVILPLWTEHALTVLPEWGYVVDQTMIMTDVAPGVPIQLLAERCGESRMRGLEVWGGAAGAAGCPGGGRPPARAQATASYGMRDHECIRHGGPTMDCMHAAPTTCTSLPPLRARLACDLVLCRVLWTKAPPLTQPLTEPRPTCHGCLPCWICCAA